MKRCDKHISLIATAIALLLSLCFRGVTPPALAQPPPETENIESAVSDGSTARVIVALQASRSRGFGVQSHDVERQQAEVMHTIDGQDFRVIHQFDMLPGLVGEVTEDGLKALQANPAVAAVALDLPVEAVLTESAAFIHADAVWRDFGILGQGVNVAVLDTGVDLTHPDLASRIVAQKCISQNGCLPDGLKESDNAQDENGHGTHVSGIIASEGNTSPRGIAPEAGLVAVRVLGSSGVGFSSDVIAGIDWVVANQAALEVRAINMSLGGGAYSNVCDEADANTMLYATAVAMAREAGITLFAASGNGGQAEQMMAPACVSGVVSVGNVYDTASASFSWGSCADEAAMPDQVACSSNSSSELDLLAPGVLIDSTKLGGGQSSKSGTSMAAPHAAAVAALLSQANPDLGPDEIEAILEETGLPVVDPRNGRETPRIDALAAVSRVIGVQTTTFSGAVLLQGRNNHSGTHIFLTEEPCSEPPPAPPTAITDSDGRFEILAADNKTYQCFRADRVGYLSAQTSSPEQDLAPITLLGGDVNGDEVVDILDLAFIASRYRTPDVDGDINADGLVNIFDLVITASNYQERGPIIIGLAP